MRRRINIKNQLAYLLISTPVLPGSTLMREEPAVINFNTLLHLHPLFLTVIKTIHKTGIPLDTKSEHIVLSFVLTFSISSPVLLRGPFRQTCSISPYSVQV